MTSMPRALATATSATLVVPQSTVTMTRRAGRDRRVDRGERQAVALVEPARDVRLDRDAEPAQGDGHDRQPGQAVGVEVAEDEDALAAGRAPGAAGASRTSASGRRRGSCRPSSGSANQAVDVVGASTRRGRRGGRPSGRTGRRPRGRGDGRRRRRRRASGRSSGSGVRPRRQDATEALHRGSTGRVRGPASGRRAPDPRGCASSSGGRAGGRPRGASPRAAGSATKIDE